LLAASTTKAVVVAALGMTIIVALMIVTIMATLVVALHALMPLHTFGAWHGSRSWVVPAMAAVIAIIFRAGQSWADQLPVGETFFFHR
jgi:hypothetical protein